MANTDPEIHSMQCNKSYHKSKGHDDIVKNLEEKIAKKKKENEKKKK